MSTMETLLDEVREAPPAMLEEVLDFVRFLKSSRFAHGSDSRRAGEDGAAEVVFDRPRTISDLAEEQRAFLASIRTPHRFPG